MYILSKDNILPFLFYNNFKQRDCGVEAFWHPKRFSVPLSAKDDSQLFFDWFGLENEVK
jgi:hypothetical protein